ncbi:LOB domain-containing protein 6-like [Pyrus ussuriensis x Pyrus communis]|uniref:LOB domain-containing protein 6-like n=1 Tax=Pyrus ussuriensis x Pyrus communis TaxID=2448454 RepID=A0A5N5EVY9_9ROSA|nr:LOB domain-containing protein 6-like [Pyrus ussuriensis x Pyrus communis]
MKPARYSITSAAAVLFTLYLCIVLIPASVFERTFFGFPTMPAKGGGSAGQACAACKHQRKKCTRDCPLAAHFPASKPETFRNAHRLYGVSNIKTILKQIHEPQQKTDAMQSIVFESGMRAKFPVTGCLGIINQLNFQLQEAMRELYHVRTHLPVVCKDQLLQDHANRRIEDNVHGQDDDLYYRNLVKPAALMPVQVQQPYNFVPPAQAFSIRAEQETDAPAAPNYQCYHDLDSNDRY